MKTSLAILLISLACSLSAHEEPSLLDKAKTAIKATAGKVAEGTKEAVEVTKEKSAELADATKQGAKKAYQKSVEATKHAAEVTKEKAAEVGAAVKEKSAEAYDATKNATKEAAKATKTKTLDLLTTKEELALYDANKDGRLDETERAKMKAATESAKAKTQTK